MGRYPGYVYSSREDITQRNMRKYDRKQNKIWDRCVELNPEFPHMNLRERSEFKDKVAKELGYADAR